MGLPGLTLCVGGEEAKAWKAVARPESHSSMEAEPAAGCCLKGCIHPRPGRLGCIHSDGPDRRGLHLGVCVCVCVCVCARAGVSFRELPATEVRAGLWERPPPVIIAVPS